tara:strand:- start:287 stop:499 length:213 start_codon:yes stop_codon:yes gene_type:complete
MTCLSEYLHNRKDFKYEEGEFTMNTPSFEVVVIPGAFDSIEIYKDKDLVFCRHLPTITMLEAICEEYKKK